jgi:CHAD domain-containing protein
VRYAADSERALVAALGRAHARGRIVHGRAREVLEFELDTADRRLEPRGARLLHEGDGRGGTSRLHLADGRVLRLGTGRPDFARDLPRGEGRTALEALAGERRLLERVRRSLRRRPLRLLDGEGKTVVRVDLEVERNAADGLDRPIARLTAVRGYAREHAGLCARLDVEPGLRRLVEPPADGTARAAIALRRDSTAAEALARWLGLRLATFLDQEAGLRADLDPEFNHDQRVAARRTRSLLGDLGSALPEAGVSTLREELRWLGGRTGPLRDLDVLASSLRSSDDLPPDVLAELLEVLERRRQAALTALRDALDSPRYAALVRTWRELADAPAPDAGSGARPFGELLAERLRKRARALRKRIRPGVAGGPTADLHELRIQAKKLRYLLECAPGLADEERLAASVNVLKRLQEHLGELHDAAVQCAALTELGGASDAAGLAPRTLLWLGRLTERAAAREARERSVLPAALEAFDCAAARKRFDKLVRELEGAA